MSDMMIRNLASACAEKLSGRVESAVVQTIRDHLPGTIEAILRENYPGQTVRIYVPMKPVTARRDRDAAIRAQYTGSNVKELAHRFGLSISSIFKIVSAGRAL